MNKITANRIYDVLVSVCGASEFEREAFVQQYIPGPCSEWRFQGHLGFGGKIYDDGTHMRPHFPRFRVRCYPEDRTPEREAMRKEADALLAAIEAEAHPAPASD
jgi:hypothetical protein